MNQNSKVQVTVKQIMSYAKINCELLNKLKSKDAWENQIL